MDSSGIRLLLQIVSLCRDAGVDLTWSLGEAARKTLDLVGVHDALLRDYAAGNDKGRAT
jgi:anti-anti-sigma regulatory factor